MNVAYHLEQFGAHPIPVTAVGHDQLGDELLHRLEAWNLDTCGVLGRPAKPTGLARVTVVDGGLLARNRPRLQPNCAEGEQ